MTNAPALQAGVQEEVPLSAETVWEVIGAFHHVRRWAPAILAERTEQTSEGTVRIISMPPDGREVRELMHEQTPFSYTYKFIGATSNARNYYGTVAVRPVDPGRCMIELLSRFDAAEGLSNEEAIANMTRSARGNLKAMKRALGLS